MKKILVAFNANNYSNALSEFAIKIARQDNSIIHAVFLAPSLAPVAQYPFPNDLPLASSAWVSNEEMIKETQDLIDAHVQLFKHDCTNASIDCTIENSDISLDDLIEHSAFADLILCDAKEELGGNFTRELLVRTHCPVLLVPQTSDVPVSAILCYDESFSSILAIKMYSYLFPEWKGLSSTVLSINTEVDSGMKYDDYLNDWLPQHFSNWKKQILQGNLQRELVSFIRKNEEPAIAVMGAYGRNAVSRTQQSSSRLWLCGRGRRRTRGC